MFCSPVGVMFLQKKKDTSASCEIEGYVERHLSFFATSKTMMCSWGPIQL